MRLAAVEQVGFREPTEIKRRPVVRSLVVSDRLRVGGGCRILTDAPIHHLFPTMKYPTPP